jgi:hypothetical protein
MTVLPTALVIKEGRALAPIWLAAAVAVVASPRLGLGLGVFAFVAGAVALGVFSIGHEYAHRTLTNLLAQPISRSRLLLSKTIVLAVMLVLLTALAAVTLLSAHATNTTSEDAAGWRLALIFLTPVLALCVAPWLTMVCRSVIAGLVFTLAVPAGLWIAGQIARAASVGFDVIKLERLKAFEYEPALVLMTIGVLALSVVAGIHGRALFVGLEALDTPRDLFPAKAPSQTTTGLPTTSRESAVRSGVRRSRIAQLVSKEVRLQGLAFAVAGLYAMAWVAMRLARTDLHIAGDSFETLSGMYGLFVALMVGAISVADERSIGTTDLQILQPWAFWKQWLVKLVTVSMVALFLGLAVPVGLEAAFPLIGDSGSAGPGNLFWYVEWRVLRSSTATILLATLFSVYASTLAVGGLRALLVTLPAASVLMALFRFLSYATWLLERRVILDLYGPSGYFNAAREWVPPWWDGLPTASRSDLRTAAIVAEWLNLAIPIGFVILIVAFAYRNSRSAERVATLARKQLPWVLAYVVLAGVTVRGVPAVLQWWLLTH